MAGRLYDQLHVDDNRQIRQGMSTDEITQVMGYPDETWSGISRKFEHQFGRASPEIEAGWDEWVWRSAWPRIYVAYVAGGTARRVGVVRESPMPPES
jgi:hypothetical protein